MGQANGICYPPGAKKFTFSTLHLPCREKSHESLMMMKSVKLGWLGPGAEQEEQEQSRAGQKQSKKRAEEGAGEEQKRSGTRARAREHRQGSSGVEKEQSKSREQSQKRYMVSGSLCPIISFIVVSYFVVS